MGAGYMKRLIALVILIMLVACGFNSSLVHKDFKGDLQQVLEKINLAYEENRNLSESEESLLEQFESKYLPGQFLVDDGMYVMSDIEKEIVRKVRSLKYFTKHEEPLSSEKTTYEVEINNIQELLNAKTVPEELIDRHPTYEEQREVHPQFIEDSKKMIEILNPVINVRNDIYQDEYDKLQEYLDTYGGDGFEIDGTHYLHNKESNDMYMTFWSIGYDIDEGALRTYSVDRFNELKDKLN